ncbi:CLUMA_CG007104, isoform A [Clunio marinus]|uniref:CLUMA_CG007104, isoform A n=1 Tax=Clunio marinus TaxID=568069 RepID=A0A1J1I033_9DIPT|nr:CLUMA_CG007104, isoform A [Clunio marinus]
MKSLKHSFVLITSSQVIKIGHRDCSQTRAKNDSLQWGVQRLKTNTNHMLQSSYSTIQQPTRRLGKRSEQLVGGKEMLLNCMFCPRLCVDFELRRERRKFCMSTMGSHETSSEVELRDKCGHV